MIEKINHILKRFPDKSESIDLLIAGDPEFREMCEDYYDCVEALRYWAKSKEDEAENRVNEYLTLIHELEIEIMEIISKPITQNTR